MTTTQPFLSFRQGGVLWKSARSKCDINSTAIAKMLGIHPHQSRQKVYRELTNQKTESEQNGSTWNLDWGRKYETPVRNMVEDWVRSHYEPQDKPEMENTGLWIKTYKNKYLVGATPDGLLKDDQVVEIKCSVPLKSGEIKEITAVPYYDIPQVLCQMECTGRDSAIYARWNGTETVSIFTLQHDPDLLYEMLDVCGEFVDTYVKPRKEPPRMNAIQKAYWMKKLVDYMAENVTFEENIDFIAAY